MRSRILDADGFMAESTFTPEHWAPNSGLYSAQDAMGVELEVAEFLYGLVRVMKPQRVCETGAYPGVATEAIVRGLEDNGVGHLHAIEAEEPYLVQMIEQFQDRDPVTFIATAPTTYLQYELVFSDSPYDQRLDQLRLWLTTRGEGAVAVVHDLRAEWDKGLFNTLIPILRINTPRGLGIIW